MAESLDDLKRQLEELKRQLAETRTPPVDSSDAKRKRVRGEILSRQIDDLERRIAEQEENEREAANPPPEKEPEPPPTPAFTLSATPTVAQPETPPGPQFGDEGYNQPSTDFSSLADSVATPPRAPLPGEERLAARQRTAAANPLPSSTIPLQEEGGKVGAADETLSSVLSELQSIDDALKGLTAEKTVASQPGYGVKDESDPGAKILAELANAREQEAVAIQQQIDADKKATTQKIIDASQGKTASSALEQVFGSLASTVGKTVESFASLIGIGGPLAGIFSHIGSAIQGVKAVGKAPEDAAKKTLQTRIAADQAQQRAISTGLEAKRVTDANEPDAPAKQRVAQQAAGVAKEASTAANAAEGAEAVAGVTAAIGAFASVAAAAVGVVVALNSIVNAAVPYVEAFAPSAVLQLNQAMYDLQATIGVALLPVVQTAVEVFRDIGSLILPVARELAPVIAKISQVVQSVLTPIFEAMATVVSALIPVFDTIIGTMGHLGDVFRAIGSVLTAVLLPVVTGIATVFKVLEPVLLYFSTLLSGLSVAVEVLSILYQTASGVIQDFFASLLPAISLKGTFDLVKDGFKELAKYTLLAVAALAKLVGFDSFVKNLEKTLAGPKREDDTGFGAAKNPQITQFADIGKQLALRASIASGTAGAKDEEKDWRKDTLKLLEELNSGTKLEAILTREVTRLGNVIATAIKEKVKEEATHAVVGAGLAVASTGFLLGVPGSGLVKAGLDISGY